MIQKNYKEKEVRINIQSVKKHYKLLLINTDINYIHNNNKNKRYECKVSLI
jgi:hypothetical protein